VTRAPSICTTNGCPNEVERSGKCADCRREANAARRKIDYGPKWRVIRASYLKRHPLCERCSDGTLATDVHHRDERGGEPGSNRDENLESICKHHHGKQTLQPYATRERIRGPATPPIEARVKQADRPVIGGGVAEQAARKQREHRERIEAEGGEPEA
jgi:5-methylcytosine-specific restriction protein A